MENTIVRLACFDDATTMAIIYSESWFKAYSSFISETDITKETDRNKRKIIFEKTIKNNGFYTFVIQKEESIIGFLIFKSNHLNSNTCELLAIYLLPDYWGKGYGTYALEYVKEFLINKLNEISTIELWVFEKNEKAKRFYQKNGFVSENINELIRVGDNYYNAVKYSLTI